MINYYVCLMPGQLEDCMVKSSSIIVHVHDWNQEFMPHGFSNAPVIFCKPQKAFVMNGIWENKFSTKKQMTKKSDTTNYFFSCQLSIP